LFLSNLFQQYRICYRFLSDLLNTLIPFFNSISSQNLVLTLVYINQANLISNITENRSQINCGNSSFRRRFPHLAKWFY